MPEYPDIVVYIERLNELVRGQPLMDLRIVSPFLLRTADPPIAVLKGQKVQGFERMGKRIVFVFPQETFLVLHLMIAGRLHWKEAGAKISPRTALAALNFPNGTLVLTEAGTKKRASMHIVRTREVLDAMNPGGLEIFDASEEAFREQLKKENHTLKRSLTDPRLFSGIGNAYSDEILHRAHLSPVLQTARMDEEQVARLFRATRDVLSEWTERLRQQTGDSFPEKVTAFHEEMAVHGKFGKPCPRCGTTVQRIRYASNETNYCPSCQTGGKLLADRALSRLLKKDWPRTPEELEELRR